MAYNTYKTIAAPKDSLKAVPQPAQIGDFDMANNPKNRHELVEKNVGLLAILIVFAISLGALVEITPLIFQKQTTEPVQNLARVLCTRNGRS